MLRNFPAKVEVLSTLPAMGLSLWWCITVLPWGTGSFWIEIPCGIFLFLLASFFIYVIGMFIVLLFLEGGSYIGKVLSKAYKKAEGQIQKESGP